MRAARKTTARRADFGKSAVLNTVREVSARFQSSSRPANTPALFARLDPRLGEAYRALMKDPTRTTDGLTKEMGHIRLILSFEPHLPDSPIETAVRWTLKNLKPLDAHTESELTVRLLASLDYRLPLSVDESVAELRRFGAEYVGQRVLAKANRESSPRRRARALYAAWQLGDDSREVSDALGHILIGSDVTAAAEAARALDAMGHPHSRAGEALARALAAEDALTRFIAADVLLCARKPMPETHDALLKAMSDTDPRVQATAVQALSSMKATGARVVRALIPLVGAEAEVEGELGARAAAIDYLGRLGDAAVVALPALLECAERSERWTRLSALKAIWEIGGKPDQVMPLLIDELLQGDGKTEFSAAEQIRAVGTAAIPYLKGVLQDKRADGNQDLAADLLKQLLAE